MTKFDWDRVHIEDIDRRRIEEELRRAEEDGRPPNLANRMFQPRGLTGRITSWKTCPSCGHRVPDGTSNLHICVSYKKSPKNGGSTNQGLGLSKASKKRSKSSKKSES